MHGTRYDIELESEVRDWLGSLSLEDYRRVMFYADLLADNAETLAEPYTRHLGGKLRELRFYLRNAQMRITYWLAPERRVVMLTVFKKTRRQEKAEIARALSAQKVCEEGMTHSQLRITDEDRNSQEYQEAKRAYELAELVRRRRMELHLSQADLAARAGMTQPQLSRLEAGGVAPTFKLLDRLARALETELIVSFKAIG